MNTPKNCEYYYFPCFSMFEGTRLFDIEEIDLIIVRDACKVRKECYIHMVFLTRIILFLHRRATNFASHKMEKMIVTSVLRITGWNIQDSMEFGQSKLSGSSPRGQDIQFITPKYPFQFVPHFFLF